MFSKSQTKLNYTFAIKAVGAKNYRQFIRLTNVDVCNPFKDLSKLSLLKEIRDANNTFPGILHKCPYSVRFLKKKKKYIIMPSRSTQSFKFYNVSIGGAMEDEPVKVNPLPSGIYRHHIAVTDDLIQPKNKLNMTVYFDLRSHSYNFFPNIWNSSINWIENEVLLVCKYKKKDLGKNFLVNKFLLKTM